MEREIIICRVRLAYILTEDMLYPFAVKIMELLPSREARIIELWRNEISKLEQLNHPNIVKFYDSCEKVEEFTTDAGEVKNVLYIVLEYVHRGRLSDFIQDLTLPEPICRFYFLQLIDVLEFLFENGFSHRDLKPDNLLLDHQYNLKLTDFGYSIKLEGRVGDEYLHSYLGTPHYMAPEIHRNCEYLGDEADLFAAGIILFELKSGHPPFHKAVETDPDYHYIWIEDYESFWVRHSEGKPPNFYSEEFKSLMNSMLAKNIVDRPTTTDIKISDWCDGGVASPREIEDFFSALRTQASPSEPPVHGEVSNITGDDNFRSLILDIKSKSKEEEEKDITPVKKIMVCKVINQWNNEHCINKM
jgi:serine/threonine protein kinase